MNSDRKGIIRAVLDRGEIREETLKPFTTEKYGDDVFHFTEMKDRLPSAVRKTDSGRIWLPSGKMLLNQ